MRDDPVGRRAEARRLAICSLYHIGLSQTYAPRTDTLWSGIAHPLVLAILAHRVPDGDWLDDPFADPEIKHSFPTISWTDACLHTNSLTVPRADTEQGPQAGEGPDGGHWDDAAYFIDSSSEGATLIQLLGVLPATLIGAMAGMPLHKVVELPPIADPELLSACRALTIASVATGLESTVISLAPALWLPCAPVPDDLPEGIDLSFLDIHVTI